MKKEPKIKLVKNNRSPLLDFNYIKERFGWDRTHILTAMRLSAKPPPQPLRQQSLHKNYKFQGLS